jgi:hypothetical protein
MGWWGAGNFDGDDPREFLAGMVGRWEQLVEKLLVGEPPEEAEAVEFDLRLDVCEACLMPTIEIIIAVAERLEPDYLPAAEIVERWRMQYLDLFDREVGNWDTSPEHVAERRGIIEATFGRLLRIVHSRFGGESIP